MQIFFENYFFGIIICSKEYYLEITKENKMGRTYRYFNGTDFDPFSDLSLEEATELGVPTLLYKKEDMYYDLLYSIYDNELSYALKEENSLGLSLIQVSPLLEWISKEELLGNLAMESLLLFHHLFHEIKNLAYYFSWNQKQKRYDVSIQDRTDIDAYYRDYVYDKLPKETSTDGYPSLEDYYAGIITVRKDKLYTPKIQNRFLEIEGEMVNFNPFKDLSTEGAGIEGIPTLLYKKGDAYYDILYERFPNELSYYLQKENHMGIYLEDVIPFTDLYPLLPMKPFSSSEEMFESLSYFPSYPYYLFYKKDYEYMLIQLMDEDTLGDYHYDWYKKKRNKQLFLSYPDAPKDV